MERGKRESNKTGKGQRGPVSAFRRNAFSCIRFQIQLPCTMCDWHPSALRLRREHPAAQAPCTGTPSQGHLVLAIHISPGSWRPSLGVQVGAALPASLLNRVQPYRKKYLKKKFYPAYIKHYFIISWLKDTKLNSVSSSPYLYTEHCRLKEL